MKLRPRNITHEVFSLFIVLHTTCSRQNIMKNGKDGKRSEIQSDTLNYVTGLTLPWLHLSRPIPWQIATGLCDNPLSCVLRAWDLGYHATRPGKPLVLVQAMNAAMWEVGDFGTHLMGETSIKN